jgi:hypothetical protein
VRVAADGRLVIRLTRRAKRALARAGKVAVSLTPDGSPSVRR